MSKRSAISLDVKLQVVKRCLKQDSNPHHEAKQLGIDDMTVVDWIRKYKADGYEGLKESKAWKTYSHELKQTAVRDVLSGKYSIREATNQHHISSKSVLTNWISKYTCGKEIKPTRKGTVHMNKGRKTTFEERIEIVQYTLANQLDDQKSMKKYDVSYQQVYAWVRKYHSGGEEVLRDRRGRSRPEEELDEAERLKLRIKELEARNEYLEMENAFEKKLAEIRRKRTR
ncbi:transposase [Paenibacillus sp. FSL H8-0548]|uniref:helix-turn-helix domain-containing protein n=1 Tax=Paenibacillus sp. FSL H8-0548 TaxID=1920422 RepID=UPI00096DD8BA|nr:helix-turn-helix domain-containing protein [Paenibacillus sp. FSL H8-0548]OMF37584.1 transposase [Paenibacillus sp. FSL H8-0548]